MSPEKEDARKLLDKLPENATWDDIMYQFYVKKKLADALKSAAEEPTHRTIPSSSVSGLNDVH